MSLGVLVKWGEHDWQDDVDVVADQIAEILVVPEIERPFGDLVKVRNCVGYNIG